MNKSNINEQSAQTEADSNSTAENQQVSQPNANTNVVGSLFGIREIKFRFWLGHIGKMTYSHSLSEVGKIIPDFTEDIIPLQYTGLKDKNGKEIYEGDIMCWDKYQNTRHDVRWVIEIDPKRPIKSWSSSSNEEDAIVIGNIFENPELLETLR